MKRTQSMSLQIITVIFSCNCHGTDFMGTLHITKHRTQSLSLHTASLARSRVSMQLTLQGVPKSRPITFAVFQLSIIILT